MYSPTVYAGPIYLLGAFDTPWTMSACCRSIHPATPVREVDVDVASRGELAHLDLS